MCSHDWAKKYVFGNVKNSKIEDIWLNKKYKFAREQLLSSEKLFAL